MMGVARIELYSTPEGYHFRTDMKAFYFSPLFLRVESQKLK